MRRRNSAARAAALSLAFVGTTVCGLVVAFSHARAERIANDVAIFAALDKVTARISKLEIPLNEPVRFGSLRVTPRACYTRGPTEEPQTITFVEVDDIELDGEEKRIFTGWMFAESPGLNAVEHPVFDVWLTACKGGQAPEAAAAAAEEPQSEEQQWRRRRAPR